ncbi:MAG: hypothetical protein RR248_00810 [Clostridia bacterium]
MYCITQGGLLWIIVLALVLLSSVLITILIAKFKKKPDPRKNIEETKPDFATPSLNANNELYVTLARNVTLTAGSGEHNEIKPGKYIMRLAVEEADATFNVRFNGLVQEFKNNQKITLGEGDSLCCVSSTLILVADL